MNTIIANRIYNLVSNDPAKIAILNLLADGKWHKRFEVESAAKSLRPTIGLVGICTILKAMQNADTELLEVYENTSGRFYRLNPQRIDIIKKIVSHYKKISTEDFSSSATEFKMFKERLRSARKNKKTDDEELKHFL